MTSEPNTPGTSAASYTGPDTQPLTGHEVFSQEETNNVWGKLLSMKGNYKSHDLCKDITTWGRAPDCDLVLQEAEVSAKIFPVFSKIHFRIFRRKVGDDTIVFLEDCSRNGTYINGTIVGKNNLRALHNNDHIGFTRDTDKVYVFMNFAQPDTVSQPEEISSRFFVSKSLGRGMFGEVHLVFERESLKRYAMKTVKLNGNPVSFSGAEISKIDSEINILQSIKHPCVVGVESIIRTPDKVHMILEYMEGGELLDRVRRCKKLSESCAKMYFYQMVLAVKYLHSKKITHRDIKPDNILLASDKMETLVKIADFGLSKLLQSGSEMNTRCGTPLYAAPEVIRAAPKGTYNKQVDIWSMGVTLFVCLGGYFPFTNNDEDYSLEQQIIRGMYTMTPRSWGKVSDVAKKLVTSMLETNPAKRITIENIEDHPWLKDEPMRRKVQELIEADTNFAWPDENSLPVTRRRVNSNDGPPVRKRRLAMNYEDEVVCGDSQHNGM